MIVFIYKWLKKAVFCRTPGKIDFKNWGPDARSGWPKRYQKLFQDSLADYGRFLELWTEVARSMEAEEGGEGAEWIQRTFVTVRTMCSYLFMLHDNATSPESLAPYPASVRTPKDGLHNLISFHSTWLG